MNTYRLIKSFKLASNRLFLCGVDSTFRLPMWNDSLTVHAMPGTWNVFKHLNNDGVHSYLLLNSHESNNTFSSSFPNKTINIVPHAYRLYLGDNESKEYFNNSLDNGYSRGSFATNVVELRTSPRFLLNISGSVLNETCSVYPNSFFFIKPVMNDCNLLYR